MAKPLASSTFTLNLHPSIGVITTRIFRSWVKARTKMNLIMEWAVNAIELEMAESMASRSKSGRMYKRPLKTYKASAPGEAPAVYSGTLLNDLKQEITQMPWGLRGEVGVGMTAIYSKFLEHGTSKMSPRPFVKPAGDKIIPLFQAKMSKVAAQMAKDMFRR